MFCLGFFHCGRRNCRTCDHSDETNKFYSTNRKTWYNIEEYIDCNSKNVIYLMTCQKCKQQYVGFTSRNFKKRVYEHLRSVQKKKRDTFGNHFNSQNHLNPLLDATENVKFCPIKKLSSSKLWKGEETKWIKELDTKENGLNKRL